MKIAKIKREKESIMSLKIKDIIKYQAQELNQKVIIKQV